VINITGGAGNNNGVGVVIGANQATFNTSAAIVITGGNGANGATIAAGGSIIHSGAQDLTIAGNGNGNGLELAGAATVKSTGTGKVVISGANAVNGNHALTLESGNIELDGTAGNAVGGALIASGADITITQGNVAGDVSISNGSIKHTVGNLTQKLTVSGSGSYVGNSNVIGDVLINTSSDTLNKINTNAANVKVKVTEGKLEINTSNDAKYDVSGSASFLSFANGNANSNVNVTNSGTFVLENQAEAKIVDINGGTLKIGTDAHNIHTLKFSGVSNTLHTTSDNLGAVGNISVTNNFDLNKSTQIQVVVNNDAIRGTKIDSTIQHDLLNLSAIANPQIDLNQLSVVAENPFIDASNHYDTNTKIVKISYKRDVAGGVSDVAKKGNISLSKAAHENLVILSEELDKSPNSDISKAQDVVMTNYFDAKGGNDEVKFKKAEKRVVEFYDRISASDQVNSSISSSLSSGISAISNRSISLIPTAANNSNPGVGVSSGSDSTKSGAWFMPFYGSSTQKLRKGIAGYKNTAYGGVVGFDTKITDNTVVGLSLANNNSLLKYKDAKSGDKTKLEGSAVSIYGATNLTSNWFTTGSLTVGTSQVKNSSKRIHGATDEIAKSKNTARSFALDSRFGYNYSVNNCYTVTPLFGMTYQNIKNSAYKETGTTAQNLSVSMSKASDRLDAVLGVKTSYLTKNFNGVLVTPEVHAFVKHDLINKNATQSINLGEIALSSKATKPVATEYNVGLSANVQYGFMEYSASYDADFATKRVGHQGSLKVRVNF
jgi:outer membrane autotransporter protein